MKTVRPIEGHFIEQNYKRKCRIGQTCELVSPRLSLDVQLHRLAASMPGTRPFYCSHSSEHCGGRKSYATSQKLVCQANGFMLSACTWGNATANDLHRESTSEHDFPMQLARVTRQSARIADLKIACASSGACAPSCIPHASCKNTESG
jgi:hypothetical protein